MQKVQSVHRHVRNRDLRPLSGNQEKHIQETDLNDVVKEVQNLLPPLLHGNRNVEVNVTLSRRSLKIVADSALMLDALLSLVRHALDAIPDGGMCSLSVREVAFKNRSILDCDNGSYGMCASIAVAHTGRGRRANMVQPPCATRAGNGEDINLSRAYRVIKQHRGSMNVESVPGQCATVTVYLPLKGRDGHTQHEIINRGYP